MTNETPYRAPYVSADEEAYAASRHHTEATGWSLAGPLLFLAGLLIFAVLNGLGVW